MLWNAGSLQNKLDDFLSLLEDEELDVAAVTETWMTSQKNNTTAELRERGYNIYHFNRDDKKGGGVALIFKNDFKLNSGNTYHFESFECILVSIACTHSRQVNFIVVYRHCEVTPSLFLTEFYKFVETIFINLNNFIVLGDFNLHVNLKCNPTIMKFYEILSTFSLTQLVHSATHKLGNILDLIIHSCNTNIRDVHIDFNNRSDHAYVFFKISQDIELKSKKTVKIRNFNNVNLDHFKSDMLVSVERYESNMYSDFSVALRDFNNMCITCVNDHVETKEVNVNIRPRPKWIDSEFRKARSERRRLYRQWKRTKDDSDRANFVKAKQTTQSLAVKKRSNFYGSSIDSCENNHKELFKICNNLLDKTNSSKLPKYTNPTSMATVFNDYFISKVENIRATFSENDSTSDMFTGVNGVDVYKGDTMSRFQLVSREEVKKVILSKPVKTSPQDPLPAVLFKASIDELLPALTVLVNLSLSTGTMDGLKDTVITPLIKKAGLDPEVLKNYRPVCNILYLSKLIERLALVQCSSHMDRIKAHIPNQSGYKPKHSCETLLMRVTNDIIVNLDKSKCTIMLLLDLSAAFDTVDHAVLLRLLWSELGFRGTVYEWFVAFLSGRRQAVNIDGQKSDFKYNACGVPQGSVMGPFLFNIYVRNLIMMLESLGFTIHGYADDHQVLFSFQIDFQVAVVRNSIPNCLDHIATWMNKHFLKLNPSKSQVIIFCPKDKVGQFVFDRVMLSDGSFIQVSNEAYDLGVTLDSQLTYSSHISSTISQGYRLLKNVAAIRKYLSVEHLKSLVNSIVVAKVDYCNSLLYGVSADNKGKLQKFQNSCARLIYRKRKCDHVSGILRELHWLPSEARTYFKILCYVYKCLYGLAPSYLTDLIIVRRHRDFKSGSSTSLF